MTLADLRQLAEQARDFRWSACAADCTWADNPNGPCSCGAERRDRERQQLFRRELGPSAIIDLIDRLQAKEGNPP